MKLQSGTILQGGRYCIVGSLGRGGFGVTYLAEQVMARRKVCIKEFFPQDYYKRDEDSVSISLLSENFKENMLRFKAKFIKEAQTIAALDHPNIIHIYDVFEENGTAYYVMDYIEGESLSELVKLGGALAEADALRYIREAASALEYIHDRNINHLDIKPGNIMVRRNDNRAILIDFGLSKHYDSESGDATSTTPVGVSHGFAPMEQYKQGGVSKFSPETDIYSLGATLYFLVTGKVPPQAADIADDGLPTLPTHLSSSVRTVIEHSMEVQRKRRPHSINEFLAYLSGGTKQTNNDDVVVAPIADSEVTRIAERDERTVLTATRTYKVGDYYNENGKKGVVFEVWDGGRHGKIVSLDETKAPWDSRIEFKQTFFGQEKLINGTETGANSKSDGKANTDKIMNRSDSKYFEAFVWCREKGDDWYLPAVDELKTIYKNKSAINSTMTEYGGTTFDGWCWSSMEANGFRAWYVYVYDGYTYSYDKSYNNSVRAVSAF